MKLRIFLACMTLSLAPLFLGGCASTPKDEPEKTNISTLPWNTPSKWERSTPLGGGGAMQY
jgi:hypothetical protein